MLKAIVIYGPPGSGKGTQAEIVADKYGLEHFNTGDIIEGIVHDPERQDDPIIQKERKNFDNGVLCTTEWVMEIVGEKIHELYNRKRGVVFSSSPRTLKEAKKYFPLLEKLFGENNVHIVRLEVSAEESIYRNSHRRVCDDCGFSIVFNEENEKMKNCPECGGKLIRRGKIDTPETIKIRLKEYEKMTVPIYDFLNEKGKKILSVKGIGTVDEVGQRVIEALEDDFNKKSK